MLAPPVVWRTRFWYHGSPREADIELARLNPPLFVCVASFGSVVSVCDSLQRHRPLAHSTPREDTDLAHHGRGHEGMAVPSTEFEMQDSVNPFTPSPPPPPPSHPPTPPPPPSHTASQSNYILTSPSTMSTIHTTTSSRAHLTYDSRSTTATTITQQAC